MMFRATTIALIAAVTASPAWAEDRVLIDYDDGHALDIANPAQWTGIAEMIGGGVTVLGEVQGAFTASGAREVAYLASDGDAVAAEPFPKLNQRIVVFNGDAQVADWALGENAAYGRPVTAADFDGDGIDEIVLEGSSYNMGTLAIGLTALKMGETPEVLQTLPDVYIDSCDAGMGQRSIESSVVSLVDGKMVGKTTTSDCTR